MGDHDGILSRFREFLIAAGLADNTVRVYDLRLRQALKWAEREGVDLDRAGPSDLRALGESFPKTHTRLRQLRSTLHWYYQMVERHDPPLKSIRVPKKPHYRNRALPEDQARPLSKTSRLWTPEGFAVDLGLYMALRIHEIATVRWDGFNHDRTWYRVYGKHPETYELPVHERLQEHLRLTRQQGEYVFPGSRGRDHITDVTAWKWIRKVSDQAGIGEIQPHILRHTAITTAHDRTGDLRAVADFARHLRLETTKLYVRTTSEQLVRVVEAIRYDGEDG